MARGIRRGEIWLHTFKAPDKRRPVLVLSRQGVISLIRTVMVAPITSTIRGVPGEVALGIDEGLKHPSVVNLDHIQTVDQRSLKHYVGSLDAAKMEAVCRAIDIATGCSGRQTPTSELSDP